MVKSRGSTQTLSIVLMIIGLIVGAGGGYFYTSSILQPKIDDYENENTELITEVSTLTADVSSLESDKSSLTSKVASLVRKNNEYQDDISELENQLSDAENTITNYEDEISDLESQISSLQAQYSTYSSTINSLQSDISELESQLEEIGEIVVTQHYEWEYGTGYWATGWFWDLPISLETYLEYCFKSRPLEWEDWVDMINDPYDDFYITSMVQKINEAAIRESFKESEKVNFVIAFVQSLPYTEDDVTTDWNEYPRYPIETLFDRGGDCEDTSILVAALLDRLGYDVCLLILDNENHCAVGVAIEGVYGTYYEHEGEQYFYLETTGEGWEIGDIPPNFTDTRAYIYPINP